MTLQYQYDKLEHSDEIRLLRFQRNLRGVLTFELITTRLTAQPKFEAVSYTWGSRSRSIELPHRSLTCVIFITQNCEDALEGIECAADMVDHEERLFWIDAVCIDQDNAYERSQQVKLMGRIFEAANNTIAYIGEPDVHFLEVNRWYSDGKREESNVMRRHAAKVIRRPWFTRTWIIQEALLSRHMTVQAGEYSFPWTVLQSLGPYNHGLVDVRSIYQGSDDSTPGMGVYLRSNQLITQRSKNRSPPPARDTAQEAATQELEWPINDRLAMSTGESLHVSGAMSPITVHNPLDLSQLLQQEDTELESGVSTAGILGSRSCSPAELWGQEDEDKNLPEQTRVVPGSTQLLHEAVSARRLRTSKPRRYISPSGSPDVLWGRVKQGDDLPEVSLLDSEETSELNIMPLMASQNLIDFGNLFDLLCETQSYSCQDPRDKLFAVLSLFSGEVPVGLEPDYSRSVEEVYTNISRFLLRYGVAKALSSARGIGIDNSVPTWITDWRMPLEKSNFCVPHQDPGSWFSAGSRSVAGFGTRQRRTLIRAIGTDGICIRGKRIQRPGQIMEVKDTARLLTGSFEDGDGFKWLQKIGHRQSARMIKRGSETGLVPPETRPDSDVICVFLGFRAPYVLRPKDPWELVGECYLPWFERGQEVAEIDWEHAYDELPPSPLEDFVIY